MHCTKSRSTMPHEEDAYVLRRKILCINCARFEEPSGTKSPCGRIQRRCLQLLALFVLPWGDHTRIRMELRSTTRATRGASWKCWVRRSAFDASASKGIFWSFGNRHSSLPIITQQACRRNAFVKAAGGWATNITILWCSAGPMVMLSFTT